MSGRSWTLLSVTLLALIALEVAESPWLGIASFAVALVACVAFCVSLGFDRPL